MSTAESRDKIDLIAAYKKILKDILDVRPSGTRQRLATTLGKNRSFVSQMANPAYAMPIPAQHLETIFELCHFSDEQRKLFLSQYDRAHAGKTKLDLVRSANRRVILDVPDLGSAERNAEFDVMLDGIIGQLARFSNLKSGHRS